MDPPSDPNPDIPNVHVGSLLDGVYDIVNPESNSLTSRWRLHGTYLVVDVTKAMRTYTTFDGYKEMEKYGGDLVTVGRTVKEFITNLRRCNIEPLFVVRGASIESFGRKFKNATNEFKYMDSEQKRHSPAALVNVVRSVALQLGVNLFQCMSEDSRNVAEIANRFRCPVLSFHKDLLLMNVFGGVILTQRFSWRYVIESTNKEYKFIWCLLYRRSHFRRKLPRLDDRSLPILKIFSDEFTEELRLPFKNPRFDPNNRHLSRLCSAGPKGDKLLPYLLWLDGKGLDRNMYLLNQSLDVLEPGERDGVRMKLCNLVRTFNYPTSSSQEFIQTLDDLYWPGFQDTYGSEISRFELRKVFRDKMGNVRLWLRNALTKSVLTRRTLELIVGQTIFLRPVVEDRQLPSVYKCQYRPMGVHLQLIRSSKKSDKPAKVFDRDGETYKEFTIDPVTHLDRYGPIDYLLYDIPTLSFEKRKSLLFATFYFRDDYDGLVAKYNTYFGEVAGQEFLLVKMLLDYLDRENQNFKQSSNFRQAVLLTATYYLTSLDRDAGSDSNSFGEFLTELNKLVDENSLERPPADDGDRPYDIRVVHQTNQLQVIVHMYNLMNAFLGDVTARVKPENWLNSCLIYNLTSGNKVRALEIPTIVRDEV